MATNNAVNVSLSGQTGTGNFVGATSPTLITPTLGVSTATSINLGGGALKTYVSESNFTPTATFATPGDLSISYILQAGKVTQIGDLVFVFMSITFTPTYTTASGALRIAGFPQIATVGTSAIPVTFAQAFTYPAGTTQLALSTVLSQSYCTLVASGSGIGAVNVATTQILSGTNVSIFATGFYSNTNF